jgi:hypothetical protein
LPGAKLVNTVLEVLCFFKNAVSEIMVKMDPAVGDPFAEQIGSFIPHGLVIIPGDNQGITVLVMKELF